MYISAETSSKFILKSFRLTLKLIFYAEMSIWFALCVFYDVPFLNDDVPSHHDEA